MGINIFGLEPEVFSQECNVLFISDQKYIDTEGVIHAGRSIKLHSMR